LAKLLPELQGANFSPASIAEISANIQNPPSVEKLLAQIDGDFVSVLLESCQAIAKLDGKITPEEAKLIDLIAQTTEGKIVDSKLQL
jgi:hypothetical protein